ncbi:MAG: PKD domain-containing protein, partial [Thermoplasmata archaeon]
VALLAVNRTTLRAGEGVLFNASRSYDRDGKVVSYFFEFGDGFSTGWISEPLFTYVYSAPGKYNARVKVGDEKGASSPWSSNITITVNEKLIELAQDYILLVESPKSTDEFRLAACVISSLVNHSGIHPVFIVNSSGLDPHSLSTLNNLTVKNYVKYYFGKSNETINNLTVQLEDNAANIVQVNDTLYFLTHLDGFSGTITVSSYEEALWASSLSPLENKVIVPGSRTYSSQEAVHARLAQLGVPLNYIIAANPLDMNSYGPCHVPSLSLTTAIFAPLRRAFVVTSWTNSTTNPTHFNNFNTTLNARASGLLFKLRNMASSRVPEYLLLIGSHDAVPQFQFTFSDEGDGYVSSDSMYGFLSPYNDTRMSTAVGRIVNLNLAGAVNMATRTACYHLYSPVVSVEFRFGTRDVLWQEMGSSINGAQITHQRDQATPGYFFCEDLRDEGFNYSYYGPSSLALSNIGIAMSLETSVEPLMESSAFIAYRGHGTGDSSAISIRSMNAAGVEGNLTSSLASRLYLPPQIALMASCENGKIYGLDYFGRSFNASDFFSLNYIYAGAVGYIGATEVSYSYPHQDALAIAGRVSGNHHWGKNNAIYAFFWDSLFNQYQRQSTSVDAQQVHGIL